MIAWNINSGFDSKWNDYLSEMMYVLMICRCFCVNVGLIKIVYRTLMVSNHT